MKEQLIKFWQDEEGATAIEYGLIAGLIAIAVIAGIGLVTGGLNGLFTGIRNALTGATPAAAGG